MFSGNEKRDSAITRLVLNVKTSLSDYGTQQNTT